MRTYLLPAVVALSLAFSAAGCSDDAATGPAAGPAFTVFPHPDWHVEDDDGTVALRVVPERLPRNLVGVPIDWTIELATADGWSPVQPVLIPTLGGCPTLPQPGDEAASVADDSPVVLWDEARGERIPWFGEPGDDPAICEIYPLRPFADGSRVHVLVGSAFKATIVPGAVPDDPAAVAAARAAGTAAPVAAWSFPVGTRKNRVEAMYAVARATLRWADGAGSLLLPIDRDPGEAYPQADTGTAFAWKGDFRVPDWTDADGLIRFDEAGEPILQGEETAQFFLLAPYTVTLEAEVPLVMYGHGLFGDAREAWYGGQRALRNRVGGVFVGTTWGMAVRYFARAGAAIGNPNYLSVLGDQVIGSMGHQLLLARLLKGELKAAIEAELGRPVSDAVDYMGISQGGILGSPLAAVSPDIRRMVLHVGGGAWTAMMTHSSNWTPEEPGGFGYGVAFAGTVPDATQRTLLQSLWQPIWDRWDPALFAGFWTDTPEGIAGPRPPADRRIYYPYSIDDPQVPNFSSETVLREAGGSLVVPSITAPLALPTLGYTDPQPQIVADQWDVGGGQPAHGDVRRLPAFVQAVRDFIRTGKAHDHCSGDACVFSPDDTVGW